MVNITMFGPWSGKKATSCEKTMKAKIVVPHGSDLEASLLPAVEEHCRVERSRLCCLACVADVCAFFALILIIMFTGFLLLKVWLVKSEVDKIQPAVVQLASDINRLRDQADALQAENSALAGAFMRSPSAVPRGLSAGTGTNSDMELEDVSHDALAKLDSQADIEDSSQVVQMLIMMVAKPTDEPAKNPNTTQELEDLFEKAVKENGAAGQDDILDGKTILDAGDNSFETTKNEFVVPSTGDDQDNDAVDDDDEHESDGESDIVQQADSDEDSDDDDEVPFTKSSKTKGSTSSADSD